MTDFLLVAVNSKFAHTNIAVRSLKLYAQKKFADLSKSDCLKSGCPKIEFGEWTINQNPFEIIRGIMRFDPKFVLFSTYIWNVSTVEMLIKNLKELNSAVKIGCGGPEVSYCAEQFMKKNPQCDFVIKGEGEETFADLASFYAEYKTLPGKNPNSIAIKGLYLRGESDVENEIVFTGEREPLCNLGMLPFPYEEFSEPDTRIYYYESSRGCPFSCAYCMSSLDKKVRFVPLEKVFFDLQKFLDANVRLVKFVDRTYNLDSERYIKIWRYILQRHNGKTMFHFEIEGEFLSGEAIEFLQTVPKGIMQFEIGVQSSNPRVLQASGRSAETQKLRENILSIPRTIHTHLDLIAGLPYEDLESFGHSFDFVMQLFPDAMQLGFLKVLHGAPIESFCAQNGWKWMQTPPYEVLETPFLSYADVLFLKDLEVVLDAYWNSHLFDTTIKYLADLHGWWGLFEKITREFQSLGFFENVHQRDFWAEKLSDFLKKLPQTFGDSNSRVALELFRFDYISQKKQSNPPSWLERHFDKDSHYEALQKITGIKNARIDFAFSDFDTFSINPFDVKNSVFDKKYSVLFLYEGRGSPNVQSAILLEN